MTRALPALAAQRGLAFGLRPLSSVSLGSGSGLAASLRAGAAAGCAQLARGGQQQVTAAPPPRQQRRQAFRTQAAAGAAADASAGNGVVVTQPPQERKAGSGKISEASGRGQIDTNPPRGTRDFFPEDKRLQNWLFGEFEGVSRLFGFEQVDFPVLESEELYVRKAGEEITDQLYNFEDKGGRRVALRPELTPSLARLALQRGKGLALPAKWFSIGQCWRYERSTRGRRREHYQWNMDIIGVPGVEAEAELLAAIVAFFSRLGLGPADVGLKVSSRKVLQAVLARYGVAEASFGPVCVVVDKMEKIPREKVVEELEKLGVAADAIDGILQALSLRSVEELEAVLGGDSQCGAVADLRQLFDLAAAYGYADWLVFDASVVRGLAYYTGVVFEGFDRAGTLRAICGGGRYDRLLGTFGGEDQPCAGFGFGDAVIVELLKDKGLLPELKHEVDDLVMPQDEALRTAATAVAARLRSAGRRVDLVLEPKRLKWAFKQAERCNAARLVLVAPDEWARGAVRVKDLAAPGMWTPLRGVAAVATCLLALAAGTAALDCTTSYMKLDLVAPVASEDPMTKCLASIRIDISAGCEVQLTALQSEGGYVPDLWAGDTVEQFPHWMTCPRGAGDPIQAVGTDKLEAVRNAIIKALRTYVYGVGPDNKPVKELEVVDVDYQPGRIIVKRSGLNNIVYAVLETNVAVEDLALDASDDEPITVTTLCSQLYHVSPLYNAQQRCLPNEIADIACQDNTYPIKIEPDTDTAIEKDTAYMICGLCPAGTHGKGSGCPTCPAGCYSRVGTSCKLCPKGTHSSAGASDCLPCPPGTFADVEGLGECKPCPEDSMSWIPGASACLRCINGVPIECKNGNCGTTPSSPGTAIFSVKQMPSCGLTAGTGFELKAYTKCQTWKQTKPKLQIAFEVAGDCSMFISPITDASCADPTDNGTSPDSTAYNPKIHPHGAIQMRAYYKSRTEIRSVLDTENEDKSLFVSVDPAGGNTVTMKFFPVTTDPHLSESTFFKTYATNMLPRCTAILTLTGGATGARRSPTTNCPPGSYQDPVMGCPACPVGYTCSNNKRLPCPPNTYMPFRGWSDPCWSCPLHGAYTTYAAAQQCDVQKLDLLCNTDRSKGYEYDIVSQTCQLTKPGYFRDYFDTTTTRGKECPAGYYSGPGALRCTACPRGEIAPEPATADQTNRSGTKCVPCAVGSLSLRSGMSAAGVAAQTAGTYCVPCPPGTWLPEQELSCMLCPDRTFRTGGATPENNVCKAVPSGYFNDDDPTRLLPSGIDTEGTKMIKIGLCPIGTTAFYLPDGTRVPADERKCIACANIDSYLGLSGPELKWAHTYAPREGLTACLPCPAGTVPRTVDGRTSACVPCPNGHYRSAFMITSTCKKCAAGSEVCTCGTQAGGEGNLECVACPEGFYTERGGNCKPAPPGTKVARTGLCNAERCLPGTYQPDEGQATCLSCRPGTYSDMPFVKSCKYCPAGTFSSWQASRCTDCPPGTFSEEGSSSCKPCRSGTFAPYSGTAMCLICPKGFKCPDFGMKKVGPCPVNTYSNRLGLAKCLPCAPAARCPGAPGPRGTHPTHISVVPRYGAGQWVEGLWGGDQTKLYERWQECPTDARTAIAIPASGAKINLIRTAIQRAIRAHVYGWQATGPPNCAKDLVVDDLDWFPGYMAVRRPSSVALYYAITENTVPASDMMNDDNLSPISVVARATQLKQTNPLNDAQAPFFDASVVHLACPLNTYSGIGQACQICPPGSYSPAGAFVQGGGGSSQCLPCPTGTYTNTWGNRECLQCPEDSYAWLPGTVSCLRCMNGIPYVCNGATCPGSRSSPGSHVVSVTQMPASSCLLTSTTSYEVKSYSKCLSWKAAAPTLQLSFRVGGDCSMIISPITDPLCAEPTNSTGLPYGALEIQAFYKTPTEIRTLLNSSLAASGTAALMVSIDPASPTGGTALTLKFFAATTDPQESENTQYIKDTVSSDPRMCVTTVNVVGGQVARRPLSGADTSCPPGTYYDQDELCPACPPGYSCPGGDPEQALLNPCPPNTYNAMWGFAGVCPTCNLTKQWTSYEGAIACNVPKVDLLCNLKDTDGVGMQYDVESQSCQPCPPGTRRNDVLKTCVECPAGTFTGPGATECEACPVGRYNPLDGLGDQTSITGLQCVACPVGYLALSGIQEAASVTDATMTTGATFCDPCPAGTYQDVSNPAKACAPCPTYTYRTGDATEQNNACKPIPAGYKLLDATHTKIDLCPKGQVSFWSAAPLDPTSVRYPSGRPGDELSCASCAELDSLMPGGSDPQWAHTYAPRKGMGQCVACPAGMKPLTVGATTTECVACADGWYRGATQITADCLICGEGREVGPSNKANCQMWLGTNDANFCQACPINTYRPTMGAQSCLPCPKGTFTQNTGNIECVSCAIGFYGNVPGLGCFPAPAGTFVNTTGAYTPTPCPRGSWNNEEGADNCNPCGPGKYANTLGSKECKSCAAGTYSRAQSTVCLDCKAGFFSSPGASTCSPCKPGTYGPDPKAPQCKLCAKGFQCPTSGLKLYSPCPKGTFSNKEGDVQCSPCPVNTYSFGGGTAARPTAVRACIKCAPGTNTRAYCGMERQRAPQPMIRLGGALESVAHALESNRQQLSRNLASAAARLPLLAPPPPFASASGGLSKVLPPEVPAALAAAVATLRGGGSSVQPVAAAQQGRPGKASQEQELVCTEYTKGKRRVYRRRRAAAAAAAAGGAGDAGVDAGSDSFSIVDDAVQHRQRLSDLAADYLLPQGYPDSVAPQYAPYMRARAWQYLFGGALSVFTTRSLLSSLGVANKASGEAAAAINWAVKDGAGRLGRFLFARWGRDLDCELKQFRLAGDVLMEAGAALELCTAMVPGAFLPLACTANLAKNLAAVAIVSTRAPIYRTFAKRNNLADVTAKGESVANLADVVGTALGIALAKTSLPVVPTFALLSVGYLLASRQEVDTVILPYLNRARLSYAARTFCATGTVPGLEEGNFSEPIMPWSDPHNGRVVLGATVEEACPGPAQLHEALHSFSGRQYALTYRPDTRKCYALLKEGAYLQSVLQAAMDAHCLLWMLDHPQPQHPQQQAATSAGPAKSKQRGGGGGGNSSKYMPHTGHSGSDATDLPPGVVGKLHVAAQQLGSAGPAPERVAVEFVARGELFREFLRQAEQGGWRLPMTSLNPKETRLVLA
ncbi:histidine-tRNA cytoplasmic isoform B [Micractinium conductrix]|uniref:histidine--tRNA ligase n=1 Tax=Micractinium conductrix TaxID=554055 RepID=A0A2P6V9K9_9CHLO|nr:histidine-tRNA cytoplasmic isoform B [Micractinium conductrix]|eukprot:PSC70770.1 histidine-tRNA cytoplasmic isoform B [Micractinium conductrix]